MKQYDETIVSEIRHQGEARLKALTNDYGVQIWAAIEKEAICDIYETSALAEGEGFFSDGDLAMAIGRALLRITTKGEAEAVEKKELSPDNRMAYPSAAERDAEWDRLLQFVQGNKDDFGPLTEEWTLADDSSEGVVRHQLLSMWTAYCVHNDLEPDTSTYDQAILKVWGLLADDCESECFASFDAYMGQFLS